MRNVVAVGADPERVALLDNFSWGDPRRPSTLGDLAAAVAGCCAASLGVRAPRSSRARTRSTTSTWATDGQRHAVPPTLVITAVAHVPDVDRCVTPELTAAGNRPRPRRDDTSRVRRQPPRRRARRSARCSPAAGEVGDRPAVRPRRSRALPPSASGDPRRVGRGVPRRRPRVDSPSPLAEMCIAGVARRHGRRRFPTTTTPSPCSPSRRVVSSSRSPRRIATEFTATMVEPVTWLGVVTDDPRPHRRRPPAPSPIADLAAAFHRGDA